MTNTATTTKRPARKAAPKSEAARIALAEKAMDRPARKPRKSRDADLEWVDGVGTTLPIKPAMKPGVDLIFHPVKATAKKAPAKRTPATKVAPVITEVSADHVAVERIKALRAEGQSWRVLSATLNTEGITTVRGKSWSANGTTAFLLGRKHGIA